MSEALDEVDAFLKELDGDGGDFPTKPLSNSIFDVSAVDDLLSDSPYSAPIVTAKPEEPKIITSAPQSSLQQLSAQSEFEPLVSPVTFTVDETKNPETSPPPVLGLDRIEHQEPAGLLKSQTIEFEAENEVPSLKEESVSTATMAVPTLDLPQLPARPVQEYQDQVKSAVSSFASSAGSFMKKFSSTIQEQSPAYVSSLKRMSISTVEALASPHSNPTSPPPPVSSPDKRKISAASSVSSNSLEKRKEKTPAQSAEAIKQFRQKLKDNKYDTEEIFRLYVRDCKRRNIEPSQKLLKQLMNASTAKKSLYALNLSGISLLPAEAHALSEVLVVIPDLKRLSMEYSNLNDETMKIISKGLILADSLPWFSCAFSYNIKSAGIKYLSLFVQKSAVLKYLDLSGIQLDLTSVSYLSQALQPQSKADGETATAVLETLKLDGCALNAAMLEKLVVGIASSKIHSLSIRGNKINAGSVGYLVPLFSSICKLRRLDVGDNEIKNNGLGILADGLKQSQNLKELSITRNQLDAQGLLVIRDILKANMSLVVLDLANNARLCSSVEAVANFKDCLILNSTLKTLSLASTGFTPESAIALAEAIPECKLHRLCLFENNAALNPLRADILNLPKSISALSQIAFKAVSTAIQRNTTPQGTKDNKDPSIALASDSAHGALIAMVVSLKMNNTITSLEILDAEDTKRANNALNAAETAREHHGLAAEVARLNREIVTICQRNAKAESKSRQELRGTNDAAEHIQPMGSTGDLSKVETEIETARQKLNLLKDMVGNLMQQSSSTSSVDSNDQAAKEVMKQLSVNCQEARQRLLEMVDLEEVAHDDKMTDRLLLLISELASVISFYDESVEGKVAQISAEVQQALKDEDAKQHLIASPSKHTFVLDDDED